jgi:hypothetical protein
MKPTVVLVVIKRFAIMKWKKDALATPLQQVSLAVVWDVYTISHDMTRLAFPVSIVDIIYPISRNYETPLVY